MNFFKLIIAALLINFFISAALAQSTKDTLKAHKVFSITIDRQIIAQKLRQNRMNISYPLNIEPNILNKCQVIGGISELNNKGNPNIQFYFTYQLLQLKSSVHVQIYFKTNYSLNETEKFIIILDFLVGQLPEEYFIKIHNITSYQEHVTHHNERSYDMLFFLNGFNNLSISGNITHSYQQLADLYTIHYMSCEGESQNMGYREGEDYLLYTLVVVPYKYMIQKFKLLEKSFSIDYPKGFKYFYGFKGTIQPQFSGLFYERAGGVVFKTQNLGKSMTYGIAFLAYPDQQDVKDLRYHASQSIIYPIIIIVLSVPICLLTFCFLCRKRMYFLRNILNQEQNMEEVNQTETTKTDLGKSDFSRPKYQINTVPEVDEKYEVSYKTSHQPSFAVNQ